MIVKIVVVEAVRKVGIPRLLRDFQAEWEPRFSGVSTERLFHSFWRRPIYFQKTWRQDRLGTTIANAVDRQHGLFSPSSVVYAFLSPRCMRIDSPRISMRWALCTKRSRMASANVGSPICSCQRDTGCCEVKISERVG